MPPKTKARTIGELRRRRYRVLPVREELRKNLVVRLKRGLPLFPGIVGFDDTVIPQLESLSHRPVGELTNTGVGAMGLKRGRPVRLHRPLVGPQKGRLLS